MSWPFRRFPRVILLVILLGCCVAGLAWLSRKSLAQPQDLPTATSALPARTPAATATATPPGAGAETLATLKHNHVPAGDWRDEAMRLRGIPDIPVVARDTPASYAPGDTAEFFVNNLDTRASRSLTAQLVYTTENVYFFVEQGVPFEQGEVRSLVDAFQNQTYPTNRAFFGSEWIPGVDSDPRLYLLYARGLGKYTGAYFDSISEFSRLAHPYSNEKEIIALNADAGRLDDAYWPPTLAHEFQHMIHWYQNPNAETWLNEGASMLAVTINGFDAGSKMNFLHRPDLQLNAWADLSSSMEEAGGHYEAAYLFMQYFLDRFGQPASQALVANRATGITAVDDTLASLELADPASGRPLTAEAVFADWVVANLLNDSRLAQGQYAYQHFTETVPGPTDSISSCPTGPIHASVHQFGARYIEISCPGDLTVHFRGAQQVALVAAQPHDGHYAIWSSRQDNSDTTLTRDVDLSGVAAATLDYWAWWKIESDYDYAYLEVSTDGGETWQILRTPSGTGANPAGSNQGWGYTGCSGGGETGQGCEPQWVHEQVDLSAYAGQKIRLRFEYLTDAALSYPSLLLDQISIPQIQHTCDFEQDSCGWASQGFARVDNVLPQAFVVTLIHQSAGQTTVERLALDASRQGSLPLHRQNGDTTILVVSGTTPFTTELANFELEIR